MQSEIDIKIHEKIHKKLVKQDPNLIFKPRVKIFDLFQKNIKKINGKVLDIGAGSGYASIWLALNTEANEIVSVESSEICVKELIPKNVKFFNTENKISILKGNYQELNFENYFDFIVSFGSIHHSSCLYETMSALSKYLKNDGYSSLSFILILLNCSFIVLFISNSLSLGYILLLKLPLPICFVDFTLGNLTRNCLIIFNNCTP